MSIEADMSRTYPRGTSTAIMDIISGLGDLEMSDICANLMRTIHDVWNITYSVRLEDERCSVWDAILAANEAVRSWIKTARKDIGPPEDGEHVLRT